MNPDDAFERILASLHEAALDDASWQAAWALIDEACGIVGSVLAVGEAVGTDVPVHFARFTYRGELRPDLEREYFDVYYPDDAGIRRLVTRPQGWLVHLPDLYTEEERKTSPAYNEGRRLLDASDGLNAHFDVSDGLCFGWFTANPAGGDGWESAQVRLIRRLLPHVRQFVRVRQALAAAGALGAGRAGLLESDRIGVVELDRGGRILAANAPALAILRRGDGLSDHDGVLEAWLPADRTRLQRLLGGALPDLRGEVPGSGSMTVQRPSGRSRLGVHVSPVCVAADFGARRVAALVLLVDPAYRPPINAARVAAMLGLTASESRMAAQLAEGRRVREIAAAEGWSEDYVRWMTKQVYRKLGVSGQVGLVRQVLAVDALPRR